VPKSPLADVFGVSYGRFPGPNKLWLRLLLERLFMKIKPNRTPGGVVVELGPNEPVIPGTLPDFSPAAPVFRLKRILVPIDFTSCSNKALHYAIPLAEQFGAQLCLLYIAPSYYLAPELAPLEVTSTETRARADAAAQLSSLAAREVPPGVKVSAYVRQGFPPTEIAMAATELEADLIVISTHGYTGLKHVWFGSVTENVVRHAHCPVLVVKEEEHEFIP
jgi:nucleotide-binding universal stress UspA family protein